jgi:hypothetical protein
MNIIKTSKILFCGSLFLASSAIFGSTNETSAQEAVKSRLTNMCNNFDTLVLEVLDQPNSTEGCFVQERAAPLGTKIAGLDLFCGMTLSVHHNQQLHHALPLKNSHQQGHVAVMNCRSLEFKIIHKDLLDLENPAATGFHGTRTAGSIEETEHFGELHK